MGACVSSVGRSQLLREASSHRYVFIPGLYPQEPPLSHNHRDLVGEFGNEETALVAKVAHLLRAKKHVKSSRVIAFTWFGRPVIPSLPPPRYSPWQIDTTQGGAKGGPAQARRRPLSGKHS